MSGKQGAHFDFGRYGRILLGVALLLGLFLARHAGACVKESFSAYQLRGEHTEGSSGVTGGESGQVERSGSYYNGGGEGATGVFSFMGSATSYCVETSSFSDPTPVYYGFLGVLGLGVLLLALDRLVGPSWRQGVRERSTASRAIKTTVDRPTDASASRRTGAQQAIPPGERYRVTGQHAALPKPATPGGASRATGHHAAIAAPIEVDLQPTGSAAIDDMFMPTSLTEVRITGEHAAPRHKTPVPAPVLASEPPLGSARPAPVPAPAAGAAAARPHLEALGLGSVDELVDRAGAMGAPLSESAQQRSAMEMILGYDNVDLNPDESLRGSSSLGAPATPAPPPPADDPFTLDMEGWEVEDEEAEQHGEGIDFDALFAGSEAPPEVPAGTPSPGSSLGEAALRAPALGERMATSAVPLAAGYQSLIPAMETGVRRLYVAPLSAGTRGTGSGSSAHDPLFGLEPALARVRGYAQRGERVEVRLLPGVYREQVKLPPNTMMVNDAVPLEDTREGRLAWLASQAPRDTALHVVIALPAHAEADEAVVELSHASDSTLMGVHLVGRALLGEAATSASGIGVRVQSSQRVTLRLCAVVGHTASEPGAGVQLLQSGGSADVDVVFLEDCLIYQNATATRGGGLYATQSSVHLDGCIIQDNVAHTAGGGLYLEDTRGRAELLQCRIEANRVECPSGLPATSSAGWSGEDGHGGGVFIRQGEVMMRNVQLTNNQAQGAGGAVYAAAALVQMEGDGQGARVVANSALRGGAVLLCGFEDEEGTTALRASHVHFINNSAEESGGALALFRMAHLELRRCVLTRNVARAHHSEGGAIHATVGARVKLEHTRIHQNAASYRGGGLALCNSSLRVLEGCEITGNRALKGDSGGLAFYTMTSSFVDSLQQHPRLELPFVCAIAACRIEDNSAARGVGGLFIGSFDKAPAYSVACVVKDAAPIAHNTVASDRPVRSPNLTLVWQGRVIGSDANPPVGRKTLG